MVHCGISGPSVLISGGPGLPFVKNELFLNFSALIIGFPVKIVLSEAHTQLKSGSTVSTVFGIKDLGSKEGALLKHLFSSNGLSLITRLNSL